MEKYEEPQICVINNYEIADKLQEKYVVAEGNLGVVKQINYDKYENYRYVNLDYQLIDNLHEYKVIIIDLQNKYNKELCFNDEKSNGSKYMFRVTYPIQEFNPSPILMDDIYAGMKCGSIRIIFSNENYEENYEVVEIIAQNSVNYYDGFTKGIYSTIGADVINKMGKKTKSNNNVLAQTVAKYVNGYNVIFDLPKILDSTKKEYVLDENYIPLMFNQDDEVISYIRCDKEKRYEILLPVCENKENLIDELLSQVLPEILPDIFPESREFKWIKSEEFKPKEVLECEKKKKKLEYEYEKQLEDIKLQEKKIYEKYQFLNDLLIQTGSVLVKAVCKYLKWLGFSNVQEIDGSEDILREDIQIIDENTIFIIEVKGIGGTSTDAECAQIVKHRRKREKENRDKEIVPIYIVNHQRHMKPQLRENPPFSDNQIDYAYNDERGLLTTWQLYQQYKLIEDGIFTKEETRQAMKKIGLITLLPNDFYSIGNVIEYYKKPNACILNIENIEIERGMSVWARKGDIWKKGRICSIQVNDNEVDTAKDGEVGLVLDIELSKGFELFIRK